MFSLDVDFFSRHFLKAYPICDDKQAWVEHDHVTGWDPRTIMRSNNTKSSTNQQTNNTQHLLIHPNIFFQEQRTCQAAENPTQLRGLLYSHLSDFGSLLCLVDGHIGKSTAAGEGSQRWGAVLGFGGCRREVFLKLPFISFFCLWDFQGQSQSLFERERRSSTNPCNRHFEAFETNLKANSILPNQSRL